MAIPNVTRSTANTAPMPRVANNTAPTTGAITSTSSSNGSRTAPARTNFDGGTRLCHTASAAAPWSDSNDDPISIRA